MHTHTFSPHTLALAARPTPPLPLTLPARCLPPRPPRPPKFILPSSRGGSESKRAPTPSTGHGRWWRRAPRRSRRRPKATRTRAPWQPRQPAATSALTSSTTTATGECVRCAWHGACAASPASLCARVRAGRRHGAPAPQAWPNCTGPRAATVQVPVPPELQRACSAWTAGWGRWWGVAGWRGGGRRCVQGHG